MYIYIYIERERDIEREREGGREIERGREIDRLPHLVAARLEAAAGAWERVCALKAA